MKIACTIVALEQHFASGLIVAMRRRRSSGPDSLIGFRGIRGGTACVVRSRGDRGHREIMRRSCS